MTHLTLICLAALLLAILVVGVYLFHVMLDWLILRDAMPESLGPLTYRAHLLEDVANRWQRTLLRWRNRLEGWARTYWWLLFCIFGGNAIAIWIGGTEYLQSWVGALLRACSGAVVGYLVLRFLLRIDVSTIAAKYGTGGEAQARASAGALIACAIVMAGCVLAVSMGM